MKKFSLAILIAFCFSALAYAQPRPVGSDKPVVKAPAAPESFEAQYEGGVVGFSGKMAGTLKFDDPNLRLVFYSKENKEIFHIPYDALIVIYPQSQAVTTTAGNVIKYIPLPGAGLAGFIKEKRRYMIATYDDPDVDAKGTVNFRLATKELLDSVLQTLADKAQLVQRGDAFYRPRALKS